MSDFGKQTRVLDYDPLTGIKEIFEATETGFTIRTEQDVTPIIERNKALQSLGRDHWKAQGEWRLEASIPIGVQYTWLTKHGVDVLNPDHKPKVVQLLNDSEWRYLKCAEVTI
jgi:hypothetical protein